MATGGPQEELVLCWLELRACALTLYDCCLLLGTSAGERSGNLIFCDGGFPVCTHEMRPSVGDAGKIS